jgi:hypothetical protein
MVGKMGDWTHGTKSARRSIGAVTREAKGCSYQYGFGTDVGHYSRSGKYPLKSVSTNEFLLYWIIGSGQLYERSADNPFKTFCRDDATAIKSDWEAVNRDFWQATVRVASKRKDAQSIFRKHLAKFREKQLELFSDEQ